MFYTSPQRFIRIETVVFKRKQFNVFGTLRTLFRITICHRVLYRRFFRNFNKNQNCKIVKLMIHYKISLENVFYTRKNPERYSHNRRTSNSGVLRTFSREEMRYN